MAEGMSREEIARLERKDNERRAVRNLERFWGNQALGRKAKIQANVATMTDAELRLANNDGRLDPGEWSETIRNIASDQEFDDEGRRNPFWYH